MELRQLLDSKEADLQRVSFEKMELEDQLQEERDL